MNVIEYISAVHINGLDRNRVDSSVIFRWLQGKTVTPFRNTNGHNYPLGMSFVFGLNGRGNANHSSNINIKTNSQTAKNLSSSDVCASIRGNNIKYSDLEICINETYDDIVYKSKTHIGDGGEVSKGIEGYGQLAKLMIGYSVFEITTHESTTFTKLFKKLKGKNVGIKRFNSELKKLGLEGWLK